MNNPTTTPAPSPVLHIPFDEAAGSTTAYDYSPARNDAAITSATFVAGHDGNAVSFDGTGQALINSDDGQTIPLAGDFTLTAWLKFPEPSDPAAPMPRLGFFVNTAQLEGSRDLWLGIPPETWVSVAVAKQGSSLTAYLDNVGAGTITAPAAVTGFALLQDIYGTGLAVADLDDVKVYDRALNPAELSRQAEESRKVAYTIDGIAFDDMDIHVSASTGVIDLPKLKEPFTADWPDYHGAVIDLTDKRLEEREISLECWVRAYSKIDFIQRLNRLFEFFRKDGTARLQVFVNPDKPLVFEVYAPEGVAVTKRWHQDKMIGTFTLKLKEPDPVKRVIRWQRSSPATATISLSLSSEKAVTVYWGDGSVTYDVTTDTSGKAQALTHTYETDGVYFIVVAGVVEEITDFSTNGIIIWQLI